MPQELAGTNQSRRDKSKRQGKWPAVKRAGAVVQVLGVEGHLR